MKKKMVLVPKLALPLTDSLVQQWETAVEAGNVFNINDAITALVNDNTNHVLRIQQVLVRRYNQWLDGWIEVRNKNKINTCPFIVAQTYDYKTGMLGILKAFEATQAIALLRERFSRLSPERFGRAVGDPILTLYVGHCVMCSQVIDLQPRILFGNTKTPPDRMKLWFEPSSSRGQLYDWVLSHASSAGVWVTVAGICDGCPYLCRDCQRMPSLTFNPEDISSLKTHGICAICGKTSLANLAAPRPTRDALLRARKSFGSLEGGRYGR